MLTVFVILVEEKGEIQERNRAERKRGKGPAELRDNKEKWSSQKSLSVRSSSINFLLLKQKY